MIQEAEYSKFLGLGGRTSNLSVVRVGTLNANDLNGKAERILSTMQSLQLDFIFVSETWCRPGQTQRIFPFTLLAREVERVIPTGHNHYGYAILFNPLRAREEEFVILAISSSETRDRLTVSFEFRGFVFSGIYQAPARPCGFLMEGLRGCAHYAIGERPHVMLGYFNARHVSFGDVESNNYGPELVEFMAMHGVSRVEPTEGRCICMQAAVRL